MESLQGKDKKTESIKENAYEETTRKIAKERKRKREIKTKNRE
jgi:hypothetical protein